MTVQLPFFWWFFFSFCLFWFAGCVFVLVWFAFCVNYCTWTAIYGLCKGPHSLSFAAFPFDGIAWFSQLTSCKNKLVERPGESHEGVGRKKISHCILLVYSHAYLVDQYWTHEHHVQCSNTLQWLHTLWWCGMPTLFTRLLPCSCGSLTGWGVTLRRNSTVASIWSTIPTAGTLPWFERQCMMCMWWLCSSNVGKAALWPRATHTMLELVFVLNVALISSRFHSFLRFGKYYWKGPKRRQGRTHKGISGS